MYNFVQTSGRRYAVLGAHGGAGTSTVIAMLDQRHASAIELTRGQQLPMTCVPVVVTRSTAYGLKRTSELLGSWHPHVPRPYLVIMRDAPLRPPRAVRYRSRALASRSLAVIEVPYMERLRHVDSPAAAIEFPEFRRAAAQLRKSLGVPAEEKEVI